jgi:cytosine deaminase
MDEFLRAAIEEAEHGLAEGGIPIGSMLVHDGRILGRGHNRRVQKGSAILHGEMDAIESAGRREMDAIESAGRRPARVYRESAIHTTLSPCAVARSSSDVISG